MLNSNYAQNHDELKRQMIIYATEIFSQKLRDFGLESYNGENLCWYRVLDHSIVQSVCFVSTFKMPFLVDVVYGLHPFYVPVPIPRKHYIPPHKLEFDETTILLRKVQVGLKKCFPGTTINCLLTPERGAEWLDIEVFPLFRKYQTEEAVYEYWKNVYFGSSEAPDCTHTFMDMVIYQNDVPLFSACYEQWKEDFDNLLSYPKMPRTLQPAFDSLKAKFEVFQTGNREPYLPLLEKKREKFVREIRAKLGIAV